MAGIALLGSCTEEFPDPLFKQGMIYGQVYMDDWETSREDVNVIAMGPYGNQSTSCDQEGNYALGDLGNGTYEMEFSKEGYGTVPLFGIQVFGDDTLRRNITLYETMGALKLPGFERVYTSDSHSWIQPENIVISTNRRVGTQTDWGMRLFFAKHPDVSFEDFFCTRVGGKLRRSGYEYYLVTAYDLPFEGGEEIYLIAYICNPDDLGYWNPYQGRFTFSTLNKEERSQILQFTMPEQ